jgi:hypothetical protein
VDVADCNTWDGAFPCIRDSAFENGAFENGAFQGARVMLKQDSVFKNDSVLKNDPGFKQEAGVQAFSFRVVRNRCHDEFERRVDECSRLAAAARNDRDRAFWLSLVARWRVVESRRPVRVARRPARLRVAAPEG